MNVEQILKDLEYYAGALPREALKQAVAHQEEITPALLKIIEDATQMPNVLKDDDYLAHTYALYLLAQFRERSAYPLIVKFFSIPDEIILDCTGDIVTEDLPRILASVSHNDASLIKSLVQNDGVNEWVRGSALDALLTQLVCGEATRDELMAYYTYLFRGGLTRTPSHVWNSLVSCSCDLYPEEVMGDIKLAFEDGLVEESFIDFGWVKETLAHGKEYVLKELWKDRRRRFIEDTAKDIKWWSCFSEPQPVWRHTTQEPSRNVREKVGRNDPCPCGSGKKYKKCCGR